MKIKIIAALLLVLLIMLYFGKRAPGFHKLTLSISGSVSDLPEEYRSSECVVIVNPPRNREELKSAAEEYCLKNIHLPDVDRYWISVIFLKETKSTPRNYTEKDKFNLISDHMDDEIIRIQFGKNARGTHRFISTYSNGEIVKDPMSVFNESLYQKEHVQSVQHGQKSQ